MAISVRTFRDLDLNFTKHPATKDVSVRTGDQAVIRSVRNLIYMAFYEKPFHPEIGSSVRQMLFENITPLTAQNIKRAVTEVIRNFEPRVEIKDVVVQAKEDQNYFEVAMEFYILNNATPVAISVFLERVK